MTLWGPSLQGFLVIGQNSPELNVSACKSEITNFCTFMLTQHELSLGEQLAYPYYHIY